MTRLDELEAMLAKATPGPWVYEGGCHVYGTDGAKSPMWVGTCPTDMVISTGVGGGDEASAIAALRNTADALIAIARAAVEHRRQRRITTDAAAALDINDSDAMTRHMIERGAVEDDSEQVMFNALDRLETDQ